MSSNLTHYCRFLALVFATTILGFCPVVLGYTLFQDNFDNNTTVGTAAWPNTAGDYNPDNPVVGIWSTQEATAQEVQVSSYVGGAQPAAHSGSNLMISGYHYEYYGNWLHVGLPCAHLINEVNQATIDYWVWGTSGMVSQVVGYACDPPGPGVFMIVLDQTGRVKWYTSTSGYVTANATWTVGIWNHVVIDLDMVADTGTVSINGSANEVFNGTYSTDTTLGRIHFYGDNINYYDDILITSDEAFEPGTIFQDNFENATAESGAPRQGADADPVAPLGTWWVKDKDYVWSEQVTTYATPGAHSGSKYLRLTSSTDSQAKATFSSAQSQDFTADFWVYAMYNGFTLNLCDSAGNYGGWLSWGGGTTGYIAYRRDGAWHTTTCTYSLDQWQHVTLTYHYSSTYPTMDIAINGVTAFNVPFYDDTKTTIASLLFAAGNAT